MTSPGAAKWLPFTAAPLTRTSPRRTAAATRDREKPVWCATMTSARLPVSSGVTTCCKAGEDQQDHAARNAGIGDVEDVRPDAIEIDEVDDVPEVHPVDDVADRAAEDHAEGDPHDERIARVLPERKPEDREHDQRHHDQQERRGAEQAERPVHVLLVRPLQKMRNDEAAFSG